VDKYLDEADAKRYRELVHKGASGSFVETEEYKELRALSDKSLARQVEIFGEPMPVPFEGKCRRCGREFVDPVPEVIDPSGYREIACMECCPGCNTLAMSVLFREISAYRTKRLVDPFRGGHYANQ